MGMGWCSGRVTMRLRAGLAEQAVDDRRIVEEAIAEVRILRPSLDSRVEHIGVERPCIPTLAEGGAEQPIGGPGARLEFRLEQNALSVPHVGRAGWQLDAE